MNTTVNKVHFAGCDVLTKAVITRSAGANYALMSAYVHIINTINKPYMYKRQKTQDILPVWICRNFKHCILDSGAYSYVFGGKKGNLREFKQLQRWQKEYINFILKYRFTGTVIECDFQNIIGAEKNWVLREELKRSVPNNIIYVWHRVEGKHNLDRLIDFSGYVGISFNEYKGKNKDYKDYVYRLVDYIKNRKPEIKIHLLGMTDNSTLSRRLGITSSDSTSHLSGARFGRIGKQRVESIKEEQKQEAERTIRRWFGNIPEFDGYDLSSKRLKWYTHLFVSVRYYKRLYESLAGNQD